MSTPSKTVATSLLALQSIASNTTVISSELDVATKFAAFVGIHFGRRAATALTDGVEIRLEASMTATLNGHWFPIAFWKTNLVASEAEAVSGTVNAGTNVITVAATANLAVYDRIFIDNSTIGNSEFGIIKAISANTSVTIEDNLLNAQTGSTIYDQAEFLSALVDLSAVKRIRLVVNAGNTGQAIAVEAEINYLDSIS